ncbi:cytochrome P450 9e2 [Cryptotermes secundus]|nr:cytochrome P450 9e2 [Cryptotermes secundus]
MSIGENYQDIYRKLDGHKYGGMFKFSQPVLIVRDPELIKNILVKDFTSFHDNDVHVNIDTDPMFGRNPFVLRGERWKITRSQLNPAFTAAKLKPLFPLVLEVCQELTDYIEKNAHTGEFETKELCARFTTNVVATCAFGIHGNAIWNPESEFRRMGRELIEPGFLQNLKFTTILLMPFIADIFKLRFVTTTLEDFFRRVVKEVAMQREQKNVNRADYLQYLINLKNKAAESSATDNGHDFASQKNIFSDDDVVAQAITFFGDGFETSSTALSFSLYALATNPDIQEKVREEVESVLKKHGGELTFDSIQEMTYLDMVFSEVLRMYPPAMFLPRQCTKPFKLETPSGASFEVEAGTPVVIPLYALHYDPQHFHDPLIFDPERFSEENKKNLHKYVYLPFGNGPRICLGSRFAMMQVKAGIAAIISNFELSRTKRTPVPFIPDPNHFLLAAKGGLWLQMKKLKRKDI